MKFAMLVPGKKLDEAVKLACMVVDAFDKFGWNVGAEAFGMHFQAGRILVFAMVPDDETKINEAGSIKELALVQYRHRWYEDPDQRGCVVLRYAGSNILYHVKRFAEERGMDWFEYAKTDNLIGERVFIREPLRRA